MSGIFGLLALRGQPVAEQMVTATTAAMAAWGRDGSRVWRGDGVVLGHMRLRSTPEARHEHLPAPDAAGRHVLTATARLDNRPELLHTLGPWETDPGDLPDTTLVLEAYRKWGENCPDHLVGDWAFALWEPRERRLFLARDHHGVSSLYYFLNSEWFAFASSLRGLLAVPAVPRSVDELYLGRAMVGLFPEPDSTPYQGVRSLPPAHALTVTPEATVHRRYWCLDDAPDVRLASDEAYVDACRALYVEAVRCRLRAAAPVGITLSGGLDSGSVATLAAEELQGTGTTLAAFSSVPQFDASGLVGRHIADETDLIEMIRASSGGIEVTYCRAEHVTPLAGVRRLLDVFASPLFHASQAYWIHAVLEAAHAGGVTVLLTGQGGNSSISWRGERRDTLRALAHARQWRPYREELVFHARSLGPRGLVGALAPGVAVRAYHRLRPQESWADRSVINPQWARELGLDRRLTENPASPLSGSSRQQRLELIASGRDTGGAAWAELSGAYGLEARDPTSDKRLVEFCLGLPEDQYVRGGQSRRLVRRVMAGRMPAEVLMNQRRGRQAADIGHRVLASRDEIDEAMYEVRWSPLSQRCLDIPRVEAAWAGLQDGLTPTTNDQAASILLPGLSIGTFLTGFE